MGFIFWLWISGSAIGCVVGDNCVYQGCNCWGNSTYCYGLGLKSIPSLVRTGFVDVLNFDYNSITSLPSNSLPPNMSYFSISNNPVTYIDVSAFDGSINTLKSLTFNSANFSSIPAALGRLRNLDYLYIYNTRILEWNLEVMKNLGATVTTLYLGECNIKAWPDWFKYFRNLTDFSLADNSISSIPDDGLDTLISTVTSINLQNNSMNSLPRALSKLLVIQDLNLQMNRITDVTWLPTSTTLRTINLSQNKLQDTNQLRQVLLPHAQSLQQLDISSNRFTSILNIEFLNNFVAFDFSFNQISDVASGSLPVNITGVIFDSNNLRAIPLILTTYKYLTNLQINHNLLTQIRDYEFPPFAISADFGFNLITELTDTSFPDNCSVITMELNNNPLRTISRLAFLKTPKLQFISLQMTKLVRVPLGLLSAQGLLDFDLTGSEDLVCTCEEKELAPWIKSLTVYSVTGLCGRTTIYDFYNRLVSDCPT